MPIADNLILGLIFSSIGLGYFLYGKKQKRLWPLLSGIALMGLPYLVHGLYAILGAGLLLPATQRLASAVAHHPHQLIHRCGKPFRMRRGIVQ